MSTRKSAAAAALKSMDSDEPPAHPPAPTAPKDEDAADDTSLNDEGLFATSNFKSGTTGLNERGRGAFAAACLCVLEQLENTEGHVNATRATGRAKCERWQLNRMPGRTDACLLFVNAIFGPILGLKPFPSWRALARALGAFAAPRGPTRSLRPLCATARRLAHASSSDAHAGDTREYLPARHWKCLELKGGGISNSTKQPWQPYR
jgi:hypothetical protein